MGDNDGIMSALVNQWKNQILEFKGGYFSFALGNEIALCLNNKYYILNCEISIWEEVKEKMTKTQEKTELIKFWLEKRKEHPLNRYSNDFEELNTLIQIKGGQNYNG